MYEPARDDEITGLVRYLGQQLEAIRLRPSASPTSRFVSGRAAVPCPSAE